MLDPAEVPGTRGAALSIALAAYAGLAELGETVEDEWTYVTSLAGVGRKRMAAAAGPAVEAPLDPAAGVAVTTVAAEARRISDPHRAIDWLSTFPAVVELSLGGWTGAGSG